MKKPPLILLFSFSLLTCSIYAQFSKFFVNVDGLTCSACSFATQKSLLQLDFVADVQMDLNSHIATVTFKEGKKVSVDLVAKKVLDAGFSVGGMSGIFKYKNTDISNDYCFNYEGDNYHFIQVTKQKLNGEIKIKFIGDKYMNKSEFKKWKAMMTGNCTLPGNTTSPAPKVYYVTIE